MIARALGLILRGGAVAAGGAPMWLWVIVALLVALAGLEGLRRVQVSTLRVEVAQSISARAKDREEAATAALRQARENATESRRRLKEMEHAQANWARDTEAARAAVAGERRAAGRLREQLAAADAAARRAAADPAATGECKATAEASLLHTDMLRWAEERLGALVEYADRARISGQLCETTYDALTAGAH